MEPKQEQKAKVFSNPKSMDSEAQGKDFKHIVRIANADLEGSKPIFQSLRKIKGISFMLANAVCSSAGIEKTKKTGYLHEEELKRLNEVIREPSKFNIPSWMFNRRKDFETGEDKHLISEDLMFIHDNDIKMLKKMRCYRGVRHSLDLPVRGQRTKGNFRKNKGKITLGVKKKAGAKAGRV